MDRVSGPGTVHAHVVHVLQMLVRRSYSIVHANTHVSGSPAAARHFGMTIMPGGCMMHESG